jgi:hypothetical protein
VGSGAHCRGNVPANGIARRLHWVIGKVGIARRRCGLGMAKHLANNDKALSAGCSHARKRMAQVMQPHVIELCCGSAIADETDPTLQRGTAPS